MNYNKFFNEAEMEYDGSFDLGDEFSGDQLIDATKAVGSETEGLKYAQRVFNDEPEEGKERGPERLIPGVSGRVKERSMAVVGPNDHYIDPQTKYEQIRVRGPFDWPGENLPRAQAKSYEDGALFIVRRLSEYLHGDEDRIKKLGS